MFESGYSQIHIYKFTCLYLQFLAYSTTAEYAKGTEHILQTKHGPFLSGRRRNRADINEKVLK